MKEKCLRDASLAQLPLTLFQSQPCGRIYASRSIAFTTPMKIWVDADACPGVIKDILFRAAERAKVQTTLVANQPMRVPASAYVRSMQVGSGFDVADKRIVELLEPNDLVITADIPLAAATIEKGAHALNPRGELYTT